MIERLFNSRHEISYRILLLLSVCKESRLSIDRIAALDFIAIYGVDFGVSEKNLHGMNSFRFSEYAGRRHLINDGIRTLVILDMFNFTHIGRDFYMGFPKKDYLFVDGFTTIMLKLILKMRRRRLTFQKNTQTENWRK